MANFSFVDGLQKRFAKMGEALNNRHVRPLDTTKHESLELGKHKDFHINVMSGCLTQQSMKDFESLTVSSFI